MKKVRLISIVLILVFAIATVNEADCFEEPEIKINNIDEFLAEQLEDAEAEELLCIYTMIYLDTENEEEKEALKEVIITLRKETGNKYGWGYNFDKNVGAEARPMTHEQKLEYGIENHAAYYLYIMNHSDDDIELNAFMTRINAITESGVQISTVGAMDIMGLGIAMDKMLKLQNNLLANQKIYSGAEKRIIVFFEGRHDIRKIIVDNIMGDHFFDDIRIDVKFLGL